VSWPAKIKDKGAIRGGFHHVTDIAPTIYEVAGISFPEEVDGVKQLPLEGKSFAESFTDPSAKSSHAVQFFEMVGNRGIYKDGWWAGARHLVPWSLLTGELWKDKEIGQHPWELYNLNDDYSQAHDLAQKNPEKLKELVELFDQEAKRNNVYPLNPVPAIFAAPPASGSHFVYREGAKRIPFLSGPYVVGRSHVITAEVEIPAPGAKGVIVAQGGQWGGFTLYIDESGHAVYEANAFGNRTGRIVSAAPVPPGKATIVVDVAIDQSQAAASGGLIKALSVGGLPSTTRLSIDGKPAGETRVSNLVPNYHETLDIGSDLGSPVSSDYAAPFSFTGVIHTVTIDLK
jgi:arylsulfatase